MCTGFRVGYSEISAFYNETVGIFIPFTYLYIFDFSLLSLSMLLRDMVALWDKKLGCKVVRGPSPSGPLGGGKKYVGIRNISYALLVIPPEKNNQDVLPVCCHLSSSVYMTFEV